MPRYTDSEIFANFEKIATEKGLIKKGEKSPRHDARTNKEIADLHGIKPEMAKGMEYDKHIGQVGRGEPVVLFSPHDKINGLVENDQERQNIMINIVQKRTHGHLNTKKLASNDLIKSLIKVANDLDNRDAEELRVLADACIADLQKQADMLDSIKNFFGEHGDDAVETGKGVAGGAVAGGLIGGILGGIFGVGAGAIPGAVLGAKIGGVAGGLIAAVSKTSPQARSVSTNSQEVLSQLNDLVKKFPENGSITDLHNQLEKLKIMAEQFANLSANPKAAGGNASAAEELTKRYVMQMDKMKFTAATFKGKAKQGDFAAHESGFMSKIKSPLYWFMDDDVEDVTDALDALVRAIDMAESGIAAVKSATQVAIIQTQSQEKEESPEDMLASFQKMYQGQDKKPT